MSGDEIICIIRIVQLIKYRLKFLRMIEHNIYNLN